MSSPLSTIILSLQPGPEPDTQTQTSESEDNTDKPILTRPLASHIGSTILSEIQRLASQYQPTSETDLDLDEYTNTLRQSCHATSVRKVKKVLEEYSQKDPETVKNLDRDTDGWTLKLEVDEEGLDVYLTNTVSGVPGLNILGVKVGSLPVVEQHEAYEEDETSSVSSLEGSARESGALSTIEEVSENGNAE